MGVVGFIGKRFPTKFHFKGHEVGHVLVRDDFGNSDDAPAYTKSVDAALAFAGRRLPDWHVELVVYSGEHFDCTTYPFGLAQATLYRYVDHERQYHSSQMLREPPFGPRHPAALAVCLAALRAMNAQQAALSSDHAKQDEGGASK